MAYVTTGFSLPYVAKYANTTGTNVFSDGTKLARGVSVSVDADVVDGKKQPVEIMKESKKAA